ncbi:relaxase domain-containing protein, partial [Achromobacter sp. MY14]|uniref:MobF family relaxase n=1 Tax=unclassified Achromobacter TaxID=2626865 RepID=UPI001E524C35
ALEFLEQELLRARQTEQGITTTERTGNAAIAKFRHETARPTDGAYSDPQLHTHALLMNLTQRADGRWVAISNDEIYRLKSMVESVYHAELASSLEKSGHQIRYEGKSFELAHISRDHIEGFSKRSQDINAELAALGETRESASRALKQTIALKTRLDKAPEISREELQRDWERQATELGIDFNGAK